MKDVNYLCSSGNAMAIIPKNEREPKVNYLESIKAFARITYKSIHVIDYQKKEFEYVSENPLFLCGHSAEEVKEMGCHFYFNYVIEEDVELLHRMNTVGFDFYESIPLNERINYSISCDFQIKNKDGEVILVNQKLTPIYLTDDGKIWKAICVISLSNEHNSGNMNIYKQGDNKIFKFDLEGFYWKTEEKIMLSKREKEILRFSVRGFTINKMAELMYVSPDTVKFHRRKLFEKLEVTNISEAIMHATNNKLL